MILAMASGKGGTGKTTVAANLAWTAAAAGMAVQFLDCDVEEPNGHIFLKPVFDSRRSVTVPTPEVVEENCDGCRICAGVCEFNALIVLGERALVFPELCHGCGGCVAVCPRQALVERGRPVGQVESGDAGGVFFVQGILDIGQVLATAVIHAVKETARKEMPLTIIDCPPGTSCPVVESVRHADFVLLVTEPTPFGLHDLKLAVAMLRALGKPFAVAVNRHDAGDEGVALYCREEAIETMLNLPDDRRIAAAYSRGELLLEALPRYRPFFRRLLLKLLSAGQKEAAG